MKLATSISFFPLILLLMKKSMTAPFWGALALAIMILPTSTQAFGQNMTQEHYDELRVLVQQHSDVESFLTAIKAQKETRKSERQARKDSIEHSVEKIEKGIIKTTTSTDPDVVAKLHERENKNSQRENVTHVVEKLANGVRVTITSTDEDIVERLQNRPDHKTRGNRKGVRRSQNRGSSRWGNRNNNEEADIDAPRQRSRRGFGRSQRGRYNR